jgi:hypothetical protein
MHSRWILDSDEHVRPSEVFALLVYYQDHLYIGTQNIRLISFNLIVVTGF